MSRRETDAEFLLRVLRDGRPHELNEILRRSFQERGCGLTVHSRASTLRERGHNVVNWTDGGIRRGSWYRLVGRLDEGDGANPVLGTVARADLSPSSSGPAGLTAESPHGTVESGAAQLSLIESSAPRGAYGEAA